MSGWEILSEGWIQASERALEQIRRLLERKDMDRLELVQSMRFVLMALHRSLLGWMNWVNNPDIMVAFNRDELVEMNRRLAEFVQEFIKYDIEVTKQGARKSGVAVEAREEAEERARRGSGETFYI
ncbi:MAG: DUF2153 family protein [Candidatus Bathyarchaeia archaeon]|nr:DUF2153 family protein [Candidatus Bathyarchaeota archaeon]